MSKQAKEIVRNFLQSEERVLVLPFDGLQEDVSKHWHKFLKMNVFEILKKAFVLGVTRRMYSSRLKNALLRSIGVKIGKNVFIAATAELDPQFPELVTIEDGVIIGMHSHIFTHEVTHAHIRLGKVTVGKNALIGGFALVRSGITIGENGVVGMGAFVTQDVPANTLVTGDPERAVKPLSRIL